MKDRIGGEYTRVRLTNSLGAPTGRYFWTASETAARSDAPMFLRSGVETASITVSSSPIMGSHGAGLVASPTIGTTSVVYRVLVR